MKLCIDARPTQNAHRTRGVGVLLNNLLAAMGTMALEDDVTLISLCEAELPPLFNRQHRLDTRRLDRPNRFNWIADQIFLRGLVRQSGADLFFATDFNSYLMPQSGLKIVSMAYDLIPFVFPEVMASQPWSVKLGWRTNFRKLKSSDAVIAISQATKDDLVNLFGLLPERVKIVYPGINHVLFNATKAGDTVRQAEVLRRYGIMRPYLLYVGDSEWRKNLRRVLEALAGIDENVGLVLAGKRALTDAILHEWVVELGLQERVVTPGFVPDDELPYLYGAAKAFVFPSLYEGFGFPVAEAMACGCPVITSNVSSMPEVAGNAALLVDPESSADIRGAMESIISNPALRDRMIKDGYCQAARFSWQRCAEETLLVLRAVVGAA